ncbi:MAG: hypothetical protein QMD06_01960 [Candidatus Altarchaeum sp.]|nr:hypothetical protein [Candidatus Altarchaeum sp.]
MNAKILLILEITFLIFYFFPFAYNENFSKIIIITSDELYRQANNLANFYNNTIPVEIYKRREF